MGLHSHKLDFCWEIWHIKAKQLHFILVVFWDKSEKWFNCSDALKNQMCVHLHTGRCPLYSDPHNLRSPFLTFVCAILFFQSSLWTSSNLVPIMLRWHGNLSTPVLAWLVWSLNNSEKQLWCNFSWNHKLLCSCFALCKTFKQKKEGLC